MDTIQSTVDRLCALSQDTHGSIDWPSDLERDAWFMSPELISIFGTETFCALSEQQQKHLSFYECMNFFSLNINGERELIEGIASRLHRNRTKLISPYLHHFLGEENKHMEYFGRFCMQYGGQVYPDRKVRFPREYAEGEEDFLFFTKVMIFEEIADAYNVRMSVDKRVHPLARSINAMHHHDEARHLVFGRTMVAHLFAEYSPKWSEEVKDGIRSYLRAYIQSTWKEYHNPQIYQDAGLEDSYSLIHQGFESDAAAERRRSLVAPMVRFLISKGILDNEQD